MKECGKHLVLPHTHESNSNVTQDLAAHASRGEGNLIQSHAVHLDGCGILVLLEVDVAHVDTKQVSLQTIRKAPMGQGLEQVKVVSSAAFMNCQLS